MQCNMGKPYTIKPAHVVTSIKQSHALKITFSCSVSLKRSQKREFACLKRPLNTGLIVYIK